MLLSYILLAYAQDPVFLNLLDTYKDYIPPLKHKIFNEGDCSKLDILFLYDTTGSMESYIEVARNAGENILSKIKSDYVDTRFAVASVRDYLYFGETGDLPYILISDFSDSTSVTLRALNKISVAGGGDYPEAYPFALRSASNEAWREDARRFTLLVADASARDDVLLKESISNSNFELIVFTPESSLSYWQNFSYYTFSLFPHENFENIVLDALEKGCAARSSDDKLALLF